MLQFALAFTLGGLVMLGVLIVIAKKLAHRHIKTHGQNSTEPIKETVIAIVGKGGETHVASH